MGVYRFPGDSAVSGDSGDAGGEPPDDGAMQARFARLEAVVEHMNGDLADLKRDVRDIRTTDFRLIFGAIIGVALGLAALMSKGFHWL
jgi:hypothetical protein